MFMQRILLCLLLTLVSNAPASAQTAPPPPPPVFRLFTLVPAERLLMDGPKGRPVVVSVGSNRFSPEYVAPTDGRLTFYRLVPAAEPDQPAVRVIVCETKVSTVPGAESLVVFLPLTGAPDPAAPPGPVRAEVLSIDAKAHPAGHVRAFNLASRPVAMKLGEQLFQLAPNGAKLLPFPGENQPWLSVALFGDDGWKRVIGSPSHLREGYRLTLFFADLPPTATDAKPFGVTMFKVADRPRTTDGE